MFNSPTREATIEEANKAVIEGAYTAFAHGDISAVLEVFADDILWHVPGRGVLSRDYHGHAAILSFLQQVMHLSQGTFRIQIGEVLAKGDRVIVLVTESATRGGREWSSPQVHAWTAKGGKAIVFWQFQGDQQTEDEFWSL